MCKRWDTLHFLAHLYDDFDYRDDDVWLSSYPRSGTAWSYEVLYAVLYEGDIAALQHAQSAGKVLKFLPIEIGSAASVPERLATWKALPSPRVIPTHLGQVLYGSWFDHTLGWWPNLQASTDTVLQYRYEDMQQDLSAQIRRLGAFFGKRLSPHAVAAIADYASFASMSVNPFTNREGNPMMDFSIARFLRKGVVGDWVTHFTAEQNERFNTIGEQKMRGTTWHQYFAV
jgi:hypothetical protein